MLFRMVRKTFGCLFSLLVVFPLLLLGLAVATVHIVTIVIEDKIEERTGFKVDFDDVDANFLTGKLQLNGTKVGNPKGFPQEFFLKIREVTVDLDLLSLFRERKVFEEMAVDIEELNYVRNKDRMLNLQQFLGAIPLAVGEVVRQVEPEEEFRYLIERVRVRLETVNYIDHSSRNARSRSFQPNLRIELEGITDVEEIVMSLTRELKRIGLGILAEPLKDSLVDTESYKDLLERIQEAAKDDTEGKGKSLIEEVQDVGEALRNVVDSLREK